MHIKQPSIIALHTRFTIMYPQQWKSTEDNLFRLIILSSQADTQCLEYMI